VASSRFSRFFCRRCGWQGTGWFGRCPECGEWGGVAEREGTRPLSEASPRPLAEASSLSARRFSTGFPEVDRVLGGGLVPGASILLGGDPGIGKSTLLLQIALHVSREAKVLYASGEESAEQVRLRADRLGPIPENLYFLATSRLEAVERGLEELSPILGVVDSLQTLEAEEVAVPAGSVAQVARAAQRLSRLAKEKGSALFLIGHITKSGVLAGPKTVEHVVDVVLYLQGDRFSSHRLLRGAKNRFGPAGEVGVFTMGERGLEEVPSPAAFFLRERIPEVSGSVVTCSFQGSRPFMVEVQALLPGPVYGSPRRVASGLDPRRVALVLAVLEKRVGLKVGQHEAYFKVVGGLELEEPAADLAVAVATASALRDVPVDPRCVLAGEVGLGGELRGIPHVLARVAEASRYGFRRFLLPRENALEVGDRVEGVEIRGLSTLREAVEVALGA